LFRWKPRETCACGLGASPRTENNEAVGGRSEAVWDAIAPEDRRVIVDIRESQEIGSGEWDWFRARGSVVVHHPWSEWGKDQPRWKNDTTYLIVCARGYRSLSALKTVPENIRALSLEGGIEGLGSLERATP
jgi:rhodanese-related sulfurtransferase